MNSLITLLLLIGVIAFAVIIIRIVGRIASWRLVLTILTVAVLAATGALNTDLIAGEIDHAVTNLFGTPTGGTNP